jgi:lactate dehydrogenase-like 2-hydroxyacid dehydrogenase
MNIVVIDRESLPQTVEFPFLEAAKYGWVERANLEEGELAEVAWRSHVLVTASKVISGALIDRLPLLKMVAIIGDCEAKSCGLVDFEAAAARGIEVSHVPGGRLDSEAAAEACMAQVVRNIDAMIAGKPLNLL